MQLKLAWKWKRNSTYMALLFTFIFFFFFHFSFTECHCNPLGSLAQTCNKHTGQCVCRSNVTGRSCDRCSEGFWNLDSQNGCQSCACNAIGSVNFTCNPYTGQCNCKVGVGGSACDSCLEGFYGFSTNGCKRKWLFDCIYSFIISLLMCSDWIFNRVFAFAPKHSKWKFNYNKKVIFSS